MAPDAAVLVLKAFGAAYAGPYDVAAPYGAHGAGAWNLRISEASGAACSARRPRLRQHECRQWRQRNKPVQWRPIHGVQRPRDLLADGVDRFGPVLSAQGLPYDFICGNIYLRQMARRR